MASSNDGISQVTEDAIVTKLLQRLQEKPGAYEGVMADLTRAGQRGLVEDSVERHAAQRRAAGEAGW